MAGDSRGGTVNGHTDECSKAMYRGPHVCICGRAGTDRLAMHSTKWAIDDALSRLDSVLMELAQRIDVMENDQLARWARIIDKGYEEIGNALDKGSRRASRRS